jgi:hypothetical protein
LAAIAIPLCLAFLLLEACRQCGLLKLLIPATSLPGWVTFTVDHGEGCNFLAGGVTCMSRSGTLMPQAHRGVRTGDTKGLDLMRGPLTGTFGGMHMGRPSEYLSVSWGITHADQHACALNAHRRAALAVGEGRVLAAPQPTSPHS